MMLKEMIVDEEQKRPNGISPDARTEYGIPADILFPSDVRYRHGFPELHPG
ncbi:hypothetical protein D3C80_2173950 [compost metagenome]